jgi:hypothetical protein
MPPKKSISKSPAKKPAAKKVAKSPTKKVVKKSPVKKTSPIKKKPTTEKELRKVIPKEVPTDIVDLVGEYLYKDIKKEAERLYDNVIVNLINPIFVPKKFFIDKIVEVFLEKYGSTFEEYLVKHEDDLKYYGYDALFEGSSYFDIIEPPNGEISMVWGPVIVDSLVDTSTSLVKNLLEKMAKREGFIGKRGKPKTLEDYLNSLKERDDDESSSDTLEDYESD